MTELKASRSSTPSRGTLNQHIESEDEKGKIDGSLHISSIDPPLDTLDEVDSIGFRGGGRF